MLAGIRPFHWLKGLDTTGIGCWNSGSLLLSFGWSSGFAFFSALTSRRFSPFC